MKALILYLNRPVRKSVRINFPLWSMVYTILNKKRIKAKRKRKNLMPKIGQNYTINEKNERRAYSVMLASRGEIKIHEILAKSDLIFKEEYIIPGLCSSNGRPLRFDFAVFDDSGELAFLIEYQGK
jgi:hypothetical protein